VRAVVESGEAASVRFVLDGEEIDVDTRAPYVVAIDMRALDPGTHVLDVIGESATGETTTQSLPFTIPERILTPTITPANVTAPQLSTPTAAAAVPTATTVSPTATVAAVPETPFEFSVSGLDLSEIVTAPQVDLEAVPAEGAEVASITFSLDGEVIADDAEAPYTASFETAELEPGEHLVEIVASGAAGETASAEIPFIIPEPTAVAALATTEAATAATTAEATVAEAEATATSADATATEAEATAPPVEATATEAVVEATAQAAEPVPLAFTLSGITLGETVGDATRTVTAEAAEGVIAESVTFSLDGEEIGTDAEAPYTVEVNTAGLTPGEHTLSAVMSSAAGETLEQSLTFTIGQPLRDLLLIGGSTLLLLLLAAAWTVMRERGSRS
jgi:hypothetical protein